MKIRKAEDKDLLTIMKNYDIGRKFMRAHGNYSQWKGNYPPESMIKEDIKKGRCYVLANKDNFPHGVFVYIYGEEPEPLYKDRKEGQWLNNKPQAVVHRLASDELEKGIGTSCLNQALSMSHNVKIDTHPDNKVMQKLLSKLGFTACGLVRALQDINPRIGYQKVQLQEDIIKRIIHIMIDEKKETEDFLKVFRPFYLSDVINYSHFYIILKRIIK